MKNSKKKKLEDFGENSLQDEIIKLQEAYKFVERREVTVKNIDDLKQLGAIYSSQMLNCSKRSVPLPELNESEEESSRRSKRPRLLILPSDGSIFNDGIPFHHFALTQLKERHINRLKSNVENWRSFAAAHDIPEDEAPLYMSAATATETPEKHRERINFTNQTLLRPWLCSKLLNRTILQVFRRCYHIFRVSSFDNDDLRKWTPEDDRKLIELYKEYGNSWEYIGNELMHPRYSCYLRYYKLIGRDNDENCDYLADHLTRNPVLVAIMPKYYNLDENVNWDDKEINLPSRSPSQIKEKWEELKNEFRAVKERTQAETIREILREVILEDTCLLSKAKIKTRGKINKNFESPKQLSEFILILKDFLEKNEIDKIRNIDGEQIKER
uniref:Myb-like DNA-binding domain containing protein n=1 Tax=Meloidogyne hapla TaxID=6305 RepID=A0A1I8AXC4_MELHA